MMGPRQVDQAALFYEFSLERHVPAGHLLRSIDRFVDLSEVRSLGILLASSGSCVAQVVGLPSSASRPLPFETPAALFGGCAHEIFRTRPQAFQGSGDRLSDGAPQKCAVREG